MAEMTEADIRLADAIAAEYGWSRASDATRERVAAHREAAEKAERQAVGQRILMCLGQWRDQMPPDCVKDFQNIAKGWGYD